MANTVKPRLSQSDFRPLYNDTYQINKDMQIEEEESINENYPKSSLEPCPDATYQTNEDANNVNNTKTNPDQAFSFDITFNPAQKSHPTLQVCKSQSIGSSNLQVTPTIITPTSSATVNINWPVVQGKIDDLNE